MTAPLVPGQPSLGRLISRVTAWSPSGTARLAVASALADALDDTADALVEHFVGNARCAGASWSTIAAVLGVSKQAAHQRFASRPTPSEGNRT
ncbi:hypothetical protein [Actinocorallia libanotica]|uniref:hypothetical protein n=1 Tax=Actinocorallia libanotica TaxID=46162 RepID=UPI0031D4C744